MTKIYIHKGPVKTFCMWFLCQRYKLDLPEQTLELKIIRIKIIQLVLRTLFSSRTSISYSCVALYYWIVRLDRVSGNCSCTASEHQLINVGFHCNATIRAIDANSSSGLNYSETCFQTTVIYQLCLFCKLHFYNCKSFFCYYCIYLS